MRHTIWISQIHCFYLLVVEMELDSSLGIRGEL